MVVSKLFLKRDFSTAAWSGEDDTGTLCSEKDNRKLAADFVKEAIRAAGFTPRIRVQREAYDGKVVVYIKDFGGKFFIRCYDDFSEAGGHEDVDTVEVNEFELGCSDYRAPYLFDDENDVAYRNGDQIVAKLARDLNMYSGTFRSLVKDEAKIISKAA